MAEDNPTNRTEMDRAVNDAVALHSHAARLAERVRGSADGVALRTLASLADGSLSPESARHAIAEARRRVLAMECAVGDFQSAAALATAVSRAGDQSRKGTAGER